MHVVRQHQISVRCSSTAFISGDSRRLLFTVACEAAAFAPHAVVTPPSRHRDFTSISVEHEIRPRRPSEKAHFRNLRGIFHLADRRLEAGHAQLQVIRGQWLQPLPEALACELDGAGPCPLRAVSVFPCASRRQDLSLDQSEIPRRFRKNRKKEFAIRWGCRRRACMTHTPHATPTPLGLGQFESTVIIQLPILSGNRPSETNAPYGAGLGTHSNNS